MKDNQKSHLARNIILLFLLAVVCIGSVELLFCRFEDPELYDHIVAPVRILSAAVRDRAEELSEALISYNRRQAEILTGARERAETQLLEALFPPEPTPEPEEEDLEQPQIASQPVISEPITLAGPEITDLLFENDREILTGGNYKLYYFNQGDEAWANEPFGVDPIGGYGCGPTVMSMVVSSMTDQIVTPAELALWAADAGYAARHSGSYSSIVPGTAEQYGLECVPLEDPDADTLYTHLAMGGEVVALMGPGHFTGGGHFILLHGVTLAGQVLVADPNSREKSLAEWDIQIILDELSYNRDSGGPLWYITPTFS